MRHAKRPADGPATSKAKRKKEDTSSSCTVPDDALPDVSSVGQEMCRRDAFRDLRNNFAQSCRKERAVKGGVLSCFSKWHFTLLRLAAGAGAKQQDTQTDPLLPQIRDCNSEAAIMDVIISELETDGFPHEAARALGRSLHKQHSLAASKLARRLEHTPKHGGVAAQVTLAPGPKPHTTDLRIGDVALRLSDAALARLHRMWLSCNDAQSPLAEGPPYGRRFLQALASLLLRYQALDGGGFQCAIPPPVFASLRKLWGVEHECFASPLNATLGAGKFFSAFPDTDRAFGSEGSFFDVAATRLMRCGSFQLNPPFSTELYAAIAKRCHALLETAEASGKALAFVLILGATSAAMGSAGVVAIRRSRFLGGELIVSVAEHVYVCGRQHMQAASASFRACDTAVLVLQTAEAARRWPTTPARLEELRAAFRETNGVRGGEDRGGTAG
jgi:hypothetical protein